MPLLSFNFFFFWRAGGGGGGCSLIFPGELVPQNLGLLCPKIVWCPKIQIIDPNIK